MMAVRAITPALAGRMVIQHHYLHRRPGISYCYGLVEGVDAVGVVTFGTPASRHLQKSACPTNPDLVLELNRLWVDDVCPANTETWFLARALRLLPPRIVVSYAELARGHAGYVYRAANFHYAGWTDMERLTPRFDYVPAASADHDPDALFDVVAETTPHSRDAFRNGYAVRRRRIPKVKYWTVTGNHTERRHLRAVAGWPVLDWKVTPPPSQTAADAATADGHPTTPTPTR